MTRYSDRNNVTNGDGGFDCKGYKSIILALAVRNWPSWPDKWLSILSRLASVLPTSYLPGVSSIFFSSCSKTPYDDLSVWNKKYKFRMWPIISNIAVTNSRSDFEIKHGDNFERYTVISNLIHKDYSQVFVWSNCTKVVSKFQIHKAFSEYLYFHNTKSVHTKQGCVNKNMHLGCTVCCSYIK